MIDAHVHLNSTHADMQAEARMRGCQCGMVRAHSTRNTHACDPAHASSLNSTYVYAPEQYEYRRQQRDESDAEAYPRECALEHRVVT
jgi:hypothetical protein